MRKTLFRPESVEAAARLEDLQTSIRVARPATVLTAGALAIALIGTTVASAFVDVPLHVDGVGVFLSENGTLIAPVMTFSSGYVSEIAVARDQHVGRGEVLARLSLPDREADLLKLERGVAAMTRDLQIRKDLNAADAAVEEQSKDRQARAMQARIEGLKTKVQTLSSRLGGLGQLQADGVISLVALQAAEISYQEALDDLSSAEAGLLALKASVEESASARQRDIMAAAAALEQARLDLDAARTALAADATVRAPADGFVSSVNIDPGALAAPGAALFEIMPSDSPDRTRQGLEAVIFVPLEQGKRVRAGDLVLLSPADLPEGVTARVVARVTEVAETPASSARLGNVLGDDALVQKIMQQGAVFEVTVTPERSGDGDLVWRSARPEGVAPNVGTPLSARVTVETRPLLALAIPAFRHVLGADRDPWAGPPG